MYYSLIALIEVDLLLGRAFRWSIIVAPTWSTALENELNEKRLKLIILYSIDKIYLSATIHKII